MADARNETRWLARGLALLVLVIGWVFIAWQNKFHFEPPTVFVCLAYLAAVGVIYNLFRTGASVVGGGTGDRDDVDDSTWSKPAGAAGELEREKRTLLKAIKEAEFDHEMGKLSKADADAMIAQYRARAIEVLKELERLSGAGGGGSVREQIEREVRARLALDDRAGKGAKKAKQKTAKADAKAAAKTAPKAEPAAPKDGEPVNDDLHDGPTPLPPAAPEESMTNDPDVVDAKPSEAAS